MTLFLFVKETYSPNPTVWSVRESFCSFGEDRIFTKGPSDLFCVYRFHEAFRIKTRDSEFDAKSDQTFSIGSYHITTLLIPPKESDLYGEYRLGPVIHRFPVFSSLTIGRTDENDIVIPIKGIQSCKIGRTEFGVEVKEGYAKSLDPLTIKLLPSEIVVKFSYAGGKLEEPFYSF